MLENSESISAVDASLLDLSTLAKANPKRIESSPNPMTKNINLLTKGEPVRKKAPMLVRLKNRRILIVPLTFAGKVGKVRSKRFVLISEVITTNLTG
jgi:hypothetical protein